MSPRVVIFDFDGVILESADIKTQAFLDLFADNPEHRDAILRHHLDNVGVSRYRKFAWIYAELLGLPLDERESRRLGEAFSDLALGRILDCPYVPGAIDCLSALQGKSRLFIASGTPQEELDLIVERRDLRRYFAGVYGTPPTKGEIITEVLCETGFTADEAVFIGDGLSDYEAAMETGVRFIARASPSGGTEWTALGLKPVPDLREIACLIDTTDASARV